MLRNLDTFNKISSLKKLLVITLLFIYLFNLAGYPLLFSYLGSQSSKQLASKIEHNFYNEKDLIEVTVELNLPYYNLQKEYEAFEGEATINGNHYNYVKRRVSGDTLYLMCLPNIKKDNLQTAKINYGKAANDFDGEEKSKSSAKKETNFSPYPFLYNDYSLTPPQSGDHIHASFISFFVPDIYISMHEIPPDFTC